MELFLKCTKKEKVPVGMGARGDAGRVLLCPVGLGILTLHLFVFLFKLRQSFLPQLESCVWSVDGEQRVLLRFAFFALSTVHSHSEDSSLLTVTHLRK